MTVNAYASLPHYAEHIDAVWSHLPEHLAGTRYAPIGRAWPGWEGAGRRRPPLTEPVIVASAADSKVMHPRSVIYLEHGAGQSYQGVDSGSYAGGPGHAHTVLFLCPSETVADRWRARYPAIPAVAVGCPKLDSWIANRESTPESGVEIAGFPRNRVENWQDSRRNRGPVVAVSWHWECPLVPETRSAWSHYFDALPRLAAALAVAGGQLLGHAHPRMWGVAERHYRRIEGIEPVKDVADVLDRADLLVCDTSSVLYEFASTGRPVLTLNAPWYRRDVEHGLRFWSAIPGLAIDGPDQLLEAVGTALDDAPHLRAMRAAAVAHAYAHVDGSAGRRAATAVEETVCGLHETSTHPTVRGGPDR